MHAVNVSLKAYQSAEMYYIKLVNQKRTETVKYKESLQIHKVMANIIRFVAINCSDCHLDCCRYFPKEEDDETFCFLDSVRPLCGTPLKNWRQHAH